MKVAIVSTYDGEGGAARAARRLHHALRGAAVDSRMFVQLRSDPDPSIEGATGNVSRMEARAHWRVDHLPAQAVGAQRGVFGVNWLGSGLRARLREFAPDVVHLHWINAGFVSIREIGALPYPVVLTAHDMWPFTGGCHYDGECGRYAQHACSRCPLQTRAPWVPLARQRLGAKVEAFRQSRVSFVSPSHWLAGVARQSPTTQGLPVQVIPNCLDLDQFKPIHKFAARDLFGLPRDAKVLLFGALEAGADPRKGLGLLEAALKLLAAGGRENLVLCIFGSATREDAVLHGFPVRRVGRLHDEASLAALYCAADIFVAPSLQDNLPNTVLEANACGVPSVAFDIGGMGDLIEHGVTGWLAAPGDVSGFAEGIAALIDDDEKRARAGWAARLRALDRFSNEIVAAQHLEVYRQALASHRPVPA